MNQPKSAVSDRSREAAGHSPALPHPPANVDPDWRERIEFAKQVREETRKAWGDSPPTFDIRGLPIRIRQ